MKFVLDLWPDDESADPQALLRYAIDSIDQNPGLVWDILDDGGEVLHENVTSGQ